MHLLDGALGVTFHLYRWRPDTPYREPEQVG